MITPSSDPSVPGPDLLHPRPSWAALLRRAVAALILCYAVALTLLFIAMALAGERFWPLAVLLYLPQHLFLLPLVILIPAALLAEVSMGTWAALAGSVIIFLWHVPFFPGFKGSPGRLEMKVITNNYAQNHGLSIEPFIAAENPDFVALEDAAGQAPAFRRAHPDRFVGAVGQFLLISRTPLISATPLNWPNWQGAPVAAVFDLAWQGEELAIYAVHLPSPRGDFAKLSGLGLLKEVAGRNRRRSDGMSFAESMTARVQLARDLAGVLAREKRPFVLLGDFNMPPNGCVHRIITTGLTDCFEQTGRGFGFTFPCDTHDPLTLGRPWLRLDYILAGPGWHAEECRVEPARRSKHRAVVAMLTRG